MLLMAPNLLMLSASEEPWDLSTASYDGVSFSVASENAPNSIAFKSDGTKMYMLGATVDSVYQYTLSTAWDLSTASYDSISFAVGSEDGLPRGLAFKDDGTKMYMLGDANDSVYQYTLSTAWDVSSASYDSVSFSVGSEEGSYGEIFFKSDGTKMYTVGFGNDTVFQYSLSTAWDLSTASYDTVSFSVAGQETSPFAMAFKVDGAKMYIGGNTNNNVYQYSLSTAWDLSTASYDSISFSVASEDNTLFGVAFKDDGTKMYIVGRTNNTIYQYSLG